MKMQSLSLAKRIFFLASLVLGFSILSLLGGESARADETGLVESSTNSSAVEDSQEADAETLPSEALSQGGDQDPSNQPAWLDFETSSDEQVADLSLDGKAEVDKSLDALSNVMNQVIQAIIDSKQYSGGLNFDYDNEKVVVSIDNAGESYLRSFFASKDILSYLRFEPMDSVDSFSEESWNGGQSLGGVCTGGFPATLGSETGLVTAAHCVVDTPTDSAPIAYQGNIFQSIHTPSSGEDIAFVGLLDQPTGLVRIQGSIYQAMYGNHNPAVGEYVCHFGIASNMLCSTIRATYSTLPLASGEILKQVAVVQSYISSPGDSGGPWFTNTTKKSAVGVHLGALTQNGVTRSVFTEIFAINSLSATLILAGIA